MRKTAGVTLLELIIAIAIVGILITAVTRAFVTGLTYETRLSEARQKQEAKSVLDERITELLKHAYLAPDDTNTDTFFIAGTGGQQVLSSDYADTLQFTVQGTRPRSELIESEDDFETQNEVYGPQGGVTEVSLSLTAVGDAGTRTGLFIRTQQPSDSEPTQGGTETVFDASVTSIQFEFWDGSAWQPSWSTTVGAEKRLPAAVRVTYSREGEREDRPHILVVRLPISDVTADAPAEQTAPGGNT